MSKPAVFFTPDITPENVVKMYELLGVKLPGKVAVKVHSGEDGNQNYLRPEFLKPIVKEVDGTIVECNTAYDGARDTTEKHEKLMAKHGWSEVFPVDIMDADGPSSDLIFPIENGRVLKQNHVGGHLANYASYSSFHTLKVILWEALVARLSSSLLDALPIKARLIFILLAQV